MIDPLSRYLHRRSAPHGPVILMYHAVQPGKGTPAWPWAVSLQRFRDQIDFLRAEGYDTPTVGELTATPEKWQGRTVALSFDDGYLDNLPAWEELLERGMRATWFIVTGSIGRAPAWPADGRPTGRLLDTSELRAMHDSGMEIGSHTVNHLRLTRANDARLSAELSDSKAALEDMLGAPVGSFAYPYGDWDERCAHAVARAGYAAACTTRTGWALRDQDPYRLRRLTVLNTDTASSLARKLSFACHDVGWRDIAGYSLRRLRSA